MAGPAHELGCVASLVTAKRRQWGSGSVYQRKSDGRWLGTIEHGYTKDGARRRVTVSAATQAECKRRLAAKAREIARGEDTAGRVTVKTWAATWLEMTQRHVRPKSHVVDVAASKWIVSTIGKRRLDQLTPADIRAVSTAITVENSTTTASRYHGTLMRMLKAALDEGHDVPARVLAVRPRAVAVTDRQAIPLPDVLSMLKVASTLPHGSRWLAAFLQGMRQGECLGLTWDQVDLDAGTLTVSWQLQPLNYADKADRSKGFRVPDGYEVRQLEGRMHLVRPKSRAGWRVIPIVPVLADSLRAWRKVSGPSPHGLVWPAAEGSPASADEDRDEWYGIQETADVRPVPPRFYFVHEARATCATLLMELGIPESTRIAIMGHSSIASTHAYEFSDVAMARDALAKVAGRLELKSVEIVRGGD